MKFYNRISLGILAGGRGSRLGGVDKAFARFENEYLCQRILRLMDSRFAAQMISARQPDERFGQMGLQPVFDKRENFSGPLAGIEALLDTTQSEFLLTVPVDIKYLPTDIIRRWLDQPEQPGLVLHDMNGLQPLLALWHVPSARITVTEALDNQQHAVHAAISQLDLKVIKRADIQVGNLNTPRDFETP